LYPSALGVGYLGEADAVGLVVLDVRDPAVAEVGQMVDDQGGSATSWPMPSARCW